MVCPACTSENPDSNRFCGVCGNALSNRPLEADLRAMVDTAIVAKLKDAKLLEVETTQAIINRLTEWAKLFGFFLGIPLALLVATLAVLGIHTYTDFTNQVNEARKQALEPLAKTAAEAKRIEDAYKHLDAQLKSTQTLSAEVSALSSKVSQIEQAVRFKQSANLTPELKQRLGNLLSRYYAYLRSVGLSPASEPPELSIISSDTNSYYDPSKNQISVTPDLATTMAPLREYTHGILVAAKPDWVRAERIGLESGLADYFPSSFLNDSDYSREILAVYRRLYPTANIPSRNLQNTHSLSELQPGRTEEHEAGTIWGGAFWDLRQHIGQAAVDRLLVAAWKNLDMIKLNADPSAFGRELLKQDARLNKNSHAEQVRAILEGRGLHL